MSKTPSTAATRLLREKGVAYTEHLYRYQEHGGTRVSARELGAGEHEKLPAAYVKGGSRGFLVRLDPREMVRLLSPALVEVGIAAE